MFNLVLDNKKICQPNFVPTIQIYILIWNYVVAKNDQLGLT